MKALKKIFDCKHALPIIITLVVLITMVAISASVAWFANRTLTPTGGAVIPGYFAGGDGSVGNPYIILTLSIFITLPGFRIREDSMSRMRMAPIPSITSFLQTISICRA